MRQLSFKRHRFPVDIIRHSIWLYARFTLSFRDVKEMLTERGLDFSYETAGGWFLTFGSAIAANLRRTGPRPGDHWHLDKMVIVIQWKRYWLWRAGAVTASHRSPRPPKRSCATRTASNSCIGACRA